MMSRIAYDPSQMRPKPRFGEQPQQPQQFGAPAAGSYPRSDPSTAPQQRPAPQQFGAPAFTLPDFSGLQSGGSTSLEGVGTVQAGNQIPLAQTIASTLGNAYGDQLGLLGNMFNTQGGVQQAQIGADASNFATTTNSQTQQILAQLQKELGMYQSDQGLAGTQYSSDASAGADRYGSDQQLAAAQAAADASRYGADRGVDSQTIASQYGALPAYYQQQRFDQSFPFFQQLSQQLLGGGGDSFSSSGDGYSVPALDPTPALNRAYADNAATEAATLNQPEYSGGAPQSGAASQRASLQEALANTEAGYQIPLAYARENRDAGLAGLAARNDQMRAQSSQLGPLLSLLGQFA